MGKNISSISELHEERQRIKNQQELCKRELASSLGVVQSVAKNRVMNISPITGAVKIATAVIGHASSQNSIANYLQSESDEEVTIQSLIPELLALGKKIYTLYQSQNDK